MDLTQIEAYTLGAIRQKAGFITAGAGRNISIALTPVFAMGGAMFTAIPQFIAKIFSYGPSALRRCLIAQSHCYVFGLMACMMVNTIVIKLM